MQPDVAQRRGAQQRVAYGVYRHVAVRMRDASFRMGNLDSAQYQPQAVRQRMHVVSVSYPEIGHMLSVFCVKIIEPACKSKFICPPRFRCKKQDLRYRELRCF